MNKPETEENVNSHQYVSVQLKPFSSAVIQDHMTQWWNEDESHIHLQWFPSDTLAMNPLDNCHSCVNLLGKDFLFV